MCGGASGPLYGRGNEAGRRRNGIDRPGNFDGLQYRGGFGDFNDCGKRSQGRQKESNRGDCRPVRALATGHRAGRHPSHLMAAIHCGAWCDGRFRMAVLGNRAVTRRAAGHAARSPSGARQRGIEEHHSQQAHACTENSASIVVRYGQSVSQLFEDDTPNTVLPAAGSAPRRVPVAKWGITRSLVLT
jgi:hypothetical protein